MYGSKLFKKAGQKVAQKAVMKKATASLSKATAPVNKATSTIKEIADTPKRKIANIKGKIVSTISQTKLAQRIDKSMKPIKDKIAQGKALQQKYSNKLKLGATKPVADKLGDIKERKEQLDREKPKEMVLRN
jgi:predicted DNA-binding protein YlxM (UPF0122 family)